MTDEFETTTLTSNAPDEFAPQEPDDSAALHPRPDDADADADLARPLRVVQFRSQRQAQFSMAIPALLLIIVGLAYLINVITPDLGLLTPLSAIGIGLAALGLGLIARFLINGRQERGLLFIALLVWLWLALGSLVALNVMDGSQVWPLAISAIGAALIGVYLFERNRDRGVLLPAIAIMLMGIAALPFTMGLFSNTFLRIIAANWPLLLIVGALLLLPGVIRKRVS